MIQKFMGKTPKIHTSAYIAEASSIIGDVSIGKDSSVWPSVVLRADVDKILIGKNSNVQDASVVHPNIGQPVKIGDNVTVGHSVVIHGSTIGDNCLLGMGSIILDGAIIGKNCIIGAGALVTQNKVIPEGSMVLGFPAKAVRSLTAREIKDLEKRAKDYVRLKNVYIRESRIEQASKDI